MGKIQINKKDVIWSYIGNFFKLITNFLLLPLVLKYLTTDELGLWFLFTSIGQIAVLLDFGFAAALSRNISYVWCGATKLSKAEIITVDNVNTDFNLLKVLLGTCRYIYLIISLFALLMLLIFGKPYIYKLSGDQNVSIAWLIFSVGVFFNLLYSYYTSFLRGVGAIAENNIAIVTSKLIQIIFSLLLLVNGYGIIGVSISYLLSGFALRIVSRYLFNKFDNIGSIIRKIKIRNKFKEYKNIFNIIWHNASKDGIVTLSNYLSTQANIIICSSILGLSTTGLYGLAVQVSTLIASIASIPYTIFHPSLQERAFKQDLTSSRKVFSGTLVIYIIMYLVMSISVILILPLIINLKPDLEINYLMFVVILFYYLIDNFYRLFASYISTFNIIPYTKAFLLSSIISVCFSFLLAKYTSMSLWALIIAPLLVSISYNLWKWPIFTLKKLNIDSFPMFMKEGVYQSVNILKKIMYKKSITKGI